MRAPDPLHVLRIVAAPEAIDAAAWPHGAVVCRVAPDEVLLLDHDGASPAMAIEDPHAIIRHDSGWVGVTMEQGDARAWLLRTADWRLPETEPAFLQGVAAGLPVKVWWTADAVRIFVPAPFAADFAERLS